MSELKALPWKLELGGYRWERLKEKHFGHMYNSKGECIGRGVPYKEALSLLTPTPLLSRPAPERHNELREALEALEFSQTMGRDNKMIGWLRLRPDASKKRGGVQFTVQEPEMLAALQAWYDQSRAALAEQAAPVKEGVK